MIIRERIWLSLPLALLISLGAGYFMAREEPMYASTATVQFKRPERVILNEQVVDASVRSEVDLNTYLQTFTSGLLRTRILESFRPQEIAILQRPYLRDLPPGTPAPHIGSLIGAVSINSIRGTLLITVTARHRDPEGAALVANRYVEQFMQFIIEETAVPNVEAVNFIRRQSEEARRQLEASELALQRYKEENNLISLDESLNIVNDQIRSINAARSRAQLDRLELEGALHQVESYRTQGRNLLEISFIAGYGSLPALKAQLEDLNRNRAVLNERYLERHPRMLEIEKQIAETRELLERTVELATSDLRSRLEKTRDSEQTLIREFEKAQHEGFRLNQLRVPFDTLTAQAVAARNHYHSLLNRLNETTTTKNLENVPLRPMDRAYPAAAPYSPDMRKIIRTCAGLGILIFFGIPLGLNLMDDRMKSSWDVEHFLGANLVGIIPTLSDLPGESKHTLINNPQSGPGAEAFLSLYSGIKLQLELDHPQSLLVTSTVPGEGKTLISCNVAGAFARHGKRTILVDCDLRRPMLHNCYQLSNDAGLLRWAEHQGGIPADPLQDALLGITRVADNLYVLRAGGRSRHATELLEKPAFEQLLESLKGHFDLIVLDSPPLAAVVDGLLLAERADEVLYVCGFNRALRKHVRVFVRRIQETKGPLLGVVLNGLSQRRIEYYSHHRYYRSYRKYYAAQT